MTRVKVDRFRVRLSVLVLSIVALSSLTPVNGERVGLPRDCALNQVKGNPQDARTFFWCLSEGPVLMKCADGLLFDASENKCISEKLKKQKAKQKQAKTQGSSSKKGKHSKPPVKCPVHVYEGEKASTAIYLADPHSCSSFYQCSHGKAYLHQCPDGLLFNPELNVCDHSANVRACTAQQQAKTMSSFETSSPPASPPPSSSATTSSKSPRNPPPPPMADSGHLNK